MILGHQKQWQFLKKSAELGRLPHAYLFCGQSQIGKKTIALEFIKLLNCKEKDWRHRPCDNCRNCQNIEKGIYPDLTVVEPKSSKIQISQIRELQSYLILRPHSAPIKAVIIDCADTMTQDAQSSFLKILEEPKGESLFILITEYQERILSTILSRCEKLCFYPVVQSELENYLAEKKVQRKTAQEIIHFSSNRPGLALDFLSNPQKLETQRERMKEIIKLRNSDFNSRFQYAKTLSESPKDIKEVLEIWLRYFRGLLLLSLKAKEQGGYSSARLINIIKLIQNTSFLLSSTNINPRLALEVLLLKI